MTVRENPVSARVFDAQHDKLVFLGAAADPALWDSLWSLDAAAVAKALAPARDGAHLVRVTSRYLRPADGPVLEGGCGTGHFVAALRAAGYQSIGIDFAPATVRALNTHAPELDIRLGDLRSIPLETSSVAGYWSIGVIEHFWNGFHPLASEMSRVLKDGGYLFCSFPFMNRLRAFKARFGLYAQRGFPAEPADFYQFALRPSAVIATMATFGLTLQAAHHSSGLKGILGEIGWLGAPLEQLYDYDGRSIFVRGLRKVCDVGLTALGTGHSVLLIFRRESR